LRYVHDKQSARIQSGIRGEFRDICAGSRNGWAGLAFPHVLSLTQTRRRMMMRFLLASIAITGLIAGAQIAAAQDRQGPGGERTAPHESGKAQQAPHAQPNQPAQHGQAAPNERRPQTTGQAPSNVPGGAAEREHNERNQGGAERERNERNQGAAERERNERNQGAAQGPRNAPATTGQGVRGSAALSTEQRTQIRTAIVREHVQPVANPGFAIAVGTVVPRTIELYALPAEIIIIEPAWRGFRFFLVGDEIVVVEPDTLRIVAVLPA
jgi:Protein of unknown function (DUF1236)